MDNNLDPKPTTSKLTGSRAGRIKVRLLKTYYGNILKDMRIICITGTTGKSVVAHYVYHILKEANEKVAILASEDEIKVGTLYKFFSDAWKLALITASSPPLPTPSKKTFSINFQSI